MVYLFGRLQPLHEVIGFLAVLVLLVLIVAQIMLFEELQLGGDVRIAVVVERHVGWVVVVGMHIAHLLVG